MWPIVLTIFSEIFFWIIFIWYACKVQVVSMYVGENRFVFFKNIILNYRVQHFSEFFSCIILYNSSSWLKFCHISRVFHVIAEWFLGICTSKDFAQFWVHNLLHSGPTSGTAVTLETGRREVPGSNHSRACRPSRSEFSMVFCECHVSTG